MRAQPYGDLTALNRSRVVLDGVGAELLGEISEAYLSLLNTSAAIYERDGAYAQGIFSSHWCRRLDRAAFDRCGTSDPREALESGRWHCHESCWREASLPAIESGAPVDVACKGGLRLYAVPIRVGDEVVGSMNFGYGAPPRERQALEEISTLYGLDVGELERLAGETPVANDEVVSAAKRQLEVAARLVGEIIARRRVEQAHLRNELCLTASLELTRMSDTSPEELASFVLDRAVELTGSEVGFLGQLSDDEQNCQSMSWSREALERCQIPGPDLCFSLTEGGLWSDAVRRRAPQIINDYRAPGQKRRPLPQGHLALERLLILPHLDNGRCPLVIAVANKPSSYGEADLRQLGLLLDGLWHELRHRRHAEERDRLKEQLLQSQKMEAVGRLAGGLAHDFNNLLTGIDGFAELLEDATDPSDPRSGDIVQIRRAAAQAAKLVQQLLSFSRRQVAAPEVIDVNGCLDQQRRMLSRLIGEDIELRFTPGDELWLIRLDPAQLEQALINLAINARDAMPRGGRLELETSNVTLKQRRFPMEARVVSGEYVRIAITDEGQGMDEALLAHIFEPFFTTKGPGRGTGLGLSMVYGIVSQSGGSLAVSSRPGEGTTVELFFPRAQAPGAAAQAPTSPSKASAPGLVLLVEDDASVRSLAKRILKRFDYEIVEASCAEEAITLFDQRPEAFLLLLSDVIMPGMNGPALLDRLRQTRPDLKALFMSGYSFEVIANQGVSAPLLPKPFTAQKLLFKVREVLEG